MKLHDVVHTGIAKAIGVYEVGGAIVDTGPEVSHRTLLESMGGSVPDHILLTHIHFDHAGATGRLVEQWPDAEVWVHERGAPHVIDPSRLTASATRIYGDDMARLWGEIVPVPEEKVHVLSGDDGEGPDGWRWFYAPGHASHHVIWLHEKTAFVGDVGGVRIGGGPVLPPTPPPDIDLELWSASLDRLEAERPERLACTHFGAYEDVPDHLRMIRDGLRDWGELGRLSDEPAYAAAVTAAISSATADPVLRAAYLQANPPNTLHGGLARYWSKKLQSDA